MQTSKALTVMDMHNAYTRGFEEGFEKGREEGFNQASTHTVKCLFGAMVIAAHELYGFGQARCMRLLNRVYGVTLETLTSIEMVERAFDEVGIEIDWSEPMEIVQEKERGNGCDAERAD